jgi:capsular exopolysaccharide synthesis family protein
MVARGHDLLTVIEASSPRYAEEVRSIKLAIDVNRGVGTNKVAGLRRRCQKRASPRPRRPSRSAAQANARVILIDRDLRNPSLSRHLAPRATIGLLEVLSGNASLDVAICRDPVTNLAFMPAVLKSPLANSSELLASDAMKNLFEQLREQFDYIVVDLSPLVPIVDVRSALSFVDAYVLIIEWGMTSIDAVQRAVHAAKAVSDKVIGVVLNKVDFKSLGRFDESRILLKKSLRTIRLCRMIWLQAVAASFRYAVGLIGIVWGVLNFPRCDRIHHQENC